MGQTYQKSPCAVKPRPGLLTRALQLLCAQQVQIQPVNCPGEGHRYQKIPLCSISSRDSAFETKSTYLCVPSRPLSKYLLSQMSPHVLALWDLQASRLHCELLEKLAGERYLRLGRGRDLAANRRPFQTYFPISKSAKVSSKISCSRRHRGS